jgi:hypothetical protein
LTLAIFRKELIIERNTLFVFTSIFLTSLIVMQSGYFLCQGILEYQLNHYGPNNINVFQLENQTCDQAKLWNRLTNTTGLTDVFVIISGLIYSLLLAIIFKVISWMILKGGINDKK